MPRRVVTNLYDDDKNALGCALILAQGDLAEYEAWYSLLFAQRHNLIVRYRPEIEARVAALIERRTLRGKEVYSIMRAAQPQHEPSKGAD